MHCASAGEPHHSVTLAWLVHLAPVLLLARVLMALHHTQAPPHAGPTTRTPRGLSGGPCTAHSDTSVFSCGVASFWLRVGPPTIVFERDMAYRALRAAGPFCVLNSTPHDTVWRCLLSLSLRCGWQLDCRYSQTDCLHCLCFVDAIGFLCWAPACFV